MRKQRTSERSARRTPAAASRRRQAMPALETLEPRTLLSAVIDSVFLERADYVDPATGALGHRYDIEVADDALTDFRMVTPWGQSFDAATFLPGGWAGGDFAHSQDNWSLEAFTAAAGDRTLELHWRPSDAQWAALDLAPTALEVDAGGQSWSGSVSFNSVVRPSQLPHFTSPLNEQENVSLKPTLRWEPWASRPANAVIWYGLGELNGEEQYEGSLPATATSWTVPGMLEPGTTYEAFIEFAVSASVNGQLVTTAAATATTVQFTTPSFDGSYTIIDTSHKPGLWTSGAGTATIDLDADTISVLFGNAGQGQFAGGVYDDGASFDSAYAFDDSLTISAGNWKGAASLDGSLIAVATAVQSADKTTSMSLLLRQTSGMSNATLVGRYNAVLWDADGPWDSPGNKFTSGIGYLDADGKGKVAFQCSQAVQGQGEIGNFSVGPDSGTYAVDEAGRVTMFDSEDDGPAMFLSQDGSMLIWTAAPDTEYMQTGLNIAFRQSTGFSAGSLSGRYYMATFRGNGTDTFSSAVGYFDFDGKGGFWANVDGMASSQDNPTENFDPDPTDRYTYTISSTGRLALEGKYTGFVSPDKSVVALACVPGEIADRETGLFLLIKAPTDVVTIAAIDDEAAETVLASPVETGTYRVSRNYTVGDLAVNFARSGAATFGHGGDYSLSVDGVDLAGTTVTIPDGADHVDIVVRPALNQPPEQVEQAVLTLSPSAAYELSTDVGERSAAVDILDYIATPAAVTGTYNIIDLSHEPGLWTSGLGTAELDADAGTIALDFTAVGQSQPVGGVYYPGQIPADPYEISNGLVFSAGDAMGAASLDGSLVAVANVTQTSDYQTGLSILLRQASGLSNASFNGRYNFVNWSADHGSELTSGVGYITADGNGQGTARMVQVAQGQAAGSAFTADPAAFNIAYSVNPGGQVRVGNDATPGFLSQDGSIYVWSATDPDVEEAGLMVALKQGSGFTAASLKGRYYLAAFQGEGTDAFSGSGYVDFDGTGRYRGIYTGMSNSQADEVLNEDPFQGTYTITSTGKISISGGVTGFISIDTSVLALAIVPGDASKHETGLVVLIKAPTDVVTIAAIDGEAAETAAAPDTGTFRISRGFTYGDLPVTFTRSGSATFGPTGDYTLSVNGVNLTAATVTIPDGAEYVDVLVRPNHNTPAERTEQAILTLPASPLYALGGAPAVRSAAVDILDFEPVVSIAALDAEASEVPAGGPADSATFRISRNTSAGNLTVNFARSGSATFGPTGDYNLSANGANLTAASVLIPNGSDHVDITVTVRDDTTAEITEAAALKLSASTTYTADPLASAATVNILDNEQQVFIEAIDPSGGEAADARFPDTATFRISRNTTTGELPVKFARSGSASFGPTGDYTLSVGGVNLTTTSVTIHDGEDHVDVTVNVRDDATAEATETAVLRLASSAAYSVDPLRAAATVGVLDNEPALAIVAVDNVAGETVLGQAANEAAFTIYRNTTAGDVLVSFAPSGTAVNGKDYTLHLADGTRLTTNTVLIADGEDHVDVVVKPIDDLLREKAETVILTLSAKPHYALPPLAANRAAGATIADNDAAAHFALSSSAFAAGQAIPDAYLTTSPPLAWADAPGTTKQFAIIMDDPDAAGYAHWVLAGIPATVFSMVEGSAPLGATEGRNSAGAIGYTGPQPPPGRLHHYRFTLYALSAELALGANLTKASLLAAMTGKVLASATLTGTYQG